MKMMLRASFASMILMHSYIVIMFNVFLHALIANSSELDIKKDIVCQGIYYFSASSNWDTGFQIETNFPPSNTTCDVIDGSLYFWGYNSTYEHYIPKSIKSVKTVTHSLIISSMKEYPPFINNIVSVGSLGFFEIDNDEVWTFSQLKQINGDITISLNDRLKISLPNLISLKSIELDSTSTQVLDLPKLTECDSITIKEEKSLRTLSGLKNVKRINGNLLIQFNSLSAFGMDSLISIAGYLQISESSESLEMIFPIGIEVGGYVYVSIYGSLTMKKLKGFVNIKGEFRAYANDAVDLSGLGKVNVGKSIFIRSNSNITMFDVSNIARINGYLSIDQNENGKFSKFESLEYAEGLLFPSCIKQNEKLEDYFPKLKHLNELQVSKTQLTNLMILKSIDNLRALSLSRNSKLTSLDGIEHFTNFTWLSIDRNSNLTSLQGLRNLTEVTHNLEIYENDKLLSLDGFDSLKYAGYIDIDRNKNLKTLKGFKNLEVIRDYFDINGNKKISIIGGFDKLQKVKEVYVDMKNQRSIKEISLGKKGNNLGNPIVEIGGIKFAKFMKLNDVKKSFSSICKTNIKFDEDNFECNGA